MLPRCAGPVAVASRRGGRISPRRAPSRRRGRGSEVVEYEEVTHRHIAQRAYRNERRHHDARVQHSQQCAAEERLGEGEGECEGEGEGAGEGEGEG